MKLKCVTSKQSEVTSYLEWKLASLEMAIAYLQTISHSEKIELIPIPIPATVLGFNSNSKILVRINSNSDSNSNSGQI